MRPDGDDRTGGPILAILAICHAHTRPTLSILGFALRDAALHSCYYCRADSGVSDQHAMTSPPSTIGGRSEIDMDLDATPAQSAKTLIFF